MIKGIMFDNDKIDNRHTIEVVNSNTIAIAIQVNEDGTYERVTYMIDDERTFGNEVIIDATEEEKEAILNEVLDATNDFFSFLANEAAEVFGEASNRLREAARENAFNDDEW